MFNFNSNHQDNMNKHLLIVSSMILLMIVILLLPYAFDMQGVKHYLSIHNVLEIFSVVYDKFKELRLDPKIFTDMIDDCYEDNEPVCLTGRISRYISVFEGIVDGYLGESEMTDEIEFQYVLNKTKVLLDYYFEKNPRFKNIYNNGGSKEEEEKLSKFL